MLNMSKTKKYTITIITLLFILFLESLVWPSYFHKQVRNLEAKLESFSVNLVDKRLDLGWDFIGGEKLTYKISNKENDIPEVLSGLQSIMEQRMEIYGQDAEIKIDNGGLIIEIKEREDAMMIREIVKMVPTLDFREKDESDNFVITNLTGESLEDVFLGINQSGNSKPLMMFEFNQAGAKLLENITSRNVGKQIGLYVDGIPLFPLNVEEPIVGGNVQIQLTIELELAKQLTQIAKAASVAPSLDLLSEQSLSESQAQLNSYNLARGFAFMLLVVFWVLIINYRFLGLIGFILLILNCFLILFFAKFAESEITHATVLGIMFSLLISSLGQILILRAIKKESNLGKSFGIASEEGFLKTKKKVEKINIVLLAIFSMVFFFTSGIIKDFSLFFLIGTFFNVVIWLIVFKTLILSLDGTIFTR